MSSDYEGIEEKKVYIFEVYGTPIKVLIEEITESTVLIYNIDSGSTYRMFIEDFEKHYIHLETLEDYTIEELKKFFANAKLEFVKEEVPFYYTTHTM